MKTSRKILIGLAVAIFGLLIAGMSLFRRDVQAIFRQAQLESNYEIIPVDEPFTRLHFPAQWTVDVRKGNQYKVELAVEANNLKTPSVMNHNGQLTFQTAQVDSKGQRGIYFAKIIVPSIREIRIDAGGKLHLEGFTSDSLRLILGDGVEYTGNSNTFDFFRLETAGGTTVQQTDTIGM